MRAGVDFYQFLGCEGDRFDRNHSDYISLHPIILSDAPVLGIDLQTKRNETCQLSSKRQFDREANHVNALDSTIRLLNTAKIR